MSTLVRKFYLVLQPTKAYLLRGWNNLDRYRSTPHWNVSVMFVMNQILFVKRMVRVSCHGKISMDRTGSPRGETIKVYCVEGSN